MNADLLHFFLLISALAIFAVALIVVSFTNQAAFKSIVGYVIDAHIAVFAGFIALLIAGGFWSVFFGQRHNLLTVGLAAVPAIICMVAVFAAHPTKRLLVEQEA